jgi:hypothetical protein
LEEIASDEEARGDAKESGQGNGYREIQNPQEIEGWIEGSVVENINFLTGFRLVAIKECKGLMMYRDTQDHRFNHWRLRLRMAIRSRHKAS